MSAGGSTFAPMVCYEAIFPHASYPKGERPDWLVVVTNDAWFGDTSGPRQHLDMARLRSIESGLPMARSANTGVSALIDGKGRILKRIKLYQAGKIEAPLPPALPRPLYDRVGDAAFWLMAAGSVIFAFRDKVLTRRNR
jgi:apolipoprotein N-acyltransferase